MSVRKRIIQEEIVMITVEMELPDEMKTFAMPENKEEQIVRNAMILYPYIRKMKISHGRAAELLGMRKQN